MPRLTTLCLALACGAATVAVSAPAWAGELKLFAEPPETDDSGKLKGSPPTIKELASVAGEEVWQLHLWAKLDKGAPGPLYATFQGKLPDGKKYKAGEFEKADYNGEKYVSWSIELDGNMGFNRNKTYQVEMNQVGNKDKIIKLASAPIKLLYTEPEAEPEDEGDDGGDEEEGGDDLTDQDVHDSLAGDDGAAGDGPPPVAPAGKKKGCSVGAQSFGGGASLALMLVLGGLVRRRRSVS